MTRPISQRDERQQLVDELFEIVKDLCCELVTYRQLFEEQRVVQLIDRAAPNAFGLLEVLLQHDIVLALSRLTDPPQSGPSWSRQDNLTLTRLKEALTKALATGHHLPKSVEDALGAAGRASASTREYRHKRLAHTDLSIYRTPAGMRRLDFHDVREEALATVAAVMAAKEYVENQRADWSRLTGCDAAKDRIQLLDEWDAGKRG